MDKSKIISAIDEYLKRSNLFLVDVEISQENDIEITIDSFERVDIENCAEISRIVDSSFNRDEQDYSLTVTSAGLDQPFKVSQQYQKYIGNEVEVILKTGIKRVATLTMFEEGSIQLQWTSLEKIEGKKKRERVDHSQTIPLDQIKSTKPFINFK